MNQIGGRNLTIISGIISGVFVALFTFVPNLWISVSFWAIAAFGVSITWAAIEGNINITLNYPER
jgi:hypothetical protein